MSEKFLLGACGDLFIEVAVGGGCGDAAAGGALEVALLEEVGLVDVLDGVLLFREGRRQGVQADGTAAELLDDDEEEAAVHGIEAGAVNLEALQGVVKFPVRIKFATLAWNTLLEALDSPVASDT